jgi:hypothetical protein
MIDGRFGIIPICTKRLRRPRSTPRTLPQWQRPLAQARLRRCLQADTQVEREMEETVLHDFADHPGGLAGSYPDLRLRRGIFTA